MRLSRLHRRALLLAVLGATTFLAAASAAAAAPATQARHALPGSTPRWLSRAHKLGATPSSAQVGFGVLLGMRDEAGAEAKLKALSDPSSPSYGQWLSNARFDADYGPASNDVRAVRTWLRSQG